MVWAADVTNPPTAAAGMNATSQPSLSAPRRNDDSLKIPLAMGRGGIRRYLHMRIQAWWRCERSSKRRDTSGWSWKSPLPQIMRQP